MFPGPHYFAGTVPNEVQLDRRTDIIPIELYNALVLRVCMSPDTTL
jgi:hypothetical protein